MDSTRWISDTHFIGNLVLIYVYTLFGFVLLIYCSSVVSLYCLMFRLISIYHICLNCFWLMKAYSIVQYCNRPFHQKQSSGKIYHTMNEVLLVIKVFTYHFTEILNFSFSNYILVLWYIRLMDFKSLLTVWLLTDYTLHLDENRMMYETSINLQLSSNSSERGWCNNIFTCKNCNCCRYDRVNGNTLLIKDCNRAIVKMV